MNTKNQIAALPNSPGVYRFFDEKDKLLYVGKSISIKKRVSSYFTDKNMGPKTNLLARKIRNIRYIKVFSEFEALLLEAQLIKKHQPFFNMQAKDDKSPLYIKITNDPIPLVTFTRKPTQKMAKGVFIKGPFQSSKTAKDIMKIIRKIFPYCHHKNPKRPCLFVHLGLCPYPYKSNKSKKEYQILMRKIKKLLLGQTKVLINELTDEMKKLAKIQKFEQAQLIKRQIEKINSLATTYYSPGEFLKQPTLVDDLSVQRLKDLKEKLELPLLPKRIECYDISNISGQLATGSMVVFENGQSAKDQYRRFKIKFAGKPDDYQMLKEILERRLKNSWKKPDLVIIDGGRGQLNAASSTIKQFKLKIPVISLAKRFEEIYVPAKILPISLPKESPARQLAQAMRDEAHRFAVSYHRLLRSKKLTT